jgi:biotin carboxyl carrier protein
MRDHPEIDPIYIDNLAFYVESWLRTPYAANIGETLMTELKVPAAGDAVSEVQIVEWVAQDGAEVKEGEVLYTLESDKSVLEIESPASGTLHILEAAGSVIPIGHVIGRID